MSAMRIVVIAGDGIGKEVMPEGIRVMEAVADKFDIELHFDHFDFSSWNYFEKHGQMLPDHWKAKSVATTPSTLVPSAGLKKFRTCLAVGFAAVVPPGI